MDPQNTVVPARTFIYLADVGALAPTDPVAALDPAWTNVGHTTPDSLSFSTEPEFEEMSSAQSNFPIRRFQTQDAATISVDLLEWSGHNFQAVYGGGTITEPTAGVFKFVPPQIGDRVEKSCIVEVIDGTKHYRYIIPRVMQIEGVEQELQRAAQSVLQLRLAVLGGDAVDPWYLITDDPAFDPTP